MSDIFFSIVTSTYNAGNSLKQCLESVRNQTFVGVEHVIVDGASSDNTCEIIQSEQNREDHRIGWWCSEKDSGIYNAWNKAIPHCKGEWILFLGADDVLANADVLENTARQIREAQKNAQEPVWFALAKVRALYTDGAEQSVMGGDWDSCGAPFLRSGIFGPLIPHQGVFHHRSSFNVLGTFDESFRIAGDSDFIVRMLQDRPGYIFVDEIVADFKLGGVSGQEAAAVAACRENIRIYRRLHFPMRNWARWKIIGWNVMKMWTFSPWFRFFGRPLANLRLKLKGRRAHWGEVEPSSQADPNQAKPNQANSNQANSNHANPNQAILNQAIPNQANPKISELKTTAPKAAVLVPFYQEEPAENEKKSFLNLLDCIQDSPVILCCPESLNTDTMLALAGEQGRDIQIERFADESFSSVRSYNLLMLHKTFYERFLQYDYVLIHQLDAWVFANELKTWCQKDYDYIGSPWFFRFGDATETSRMLPWAGNGGFSLRRVKAMLSVIEKIQQAPTLRERLLLLWLCEKRLKFKLLRKLLLQPFDSALNYYRELDIWEDQVYAILHNDMINVASPEESRGFAFEVNPKRLYKENQYKLPFGCHAWEKFEPEFWKAFQEHSNSES